MSTDAQKIEELTKQVAELEAFKANCKCQRGKTKQQEKKKKKKNKVCKSDAIVKITPDGDVDWKEMEAEIRKIEVDGLMWATVFSLEDFVFGMKALSVGFQIEDLMVPETAPVVELLSKLKGCNSAELVNIQTAQADWGGVSSGNAPKKSKNKKKKGKAEAKLEITDKEIQAAASQFAMLARDAAPAYVAGVAAMDRSGAMDVTEAQLRQVAEIVNQKKPELAFMLIAAGKTTCSALMFIPAFHAETPGSDALACVKHAFQLEEKAVCTGDKAVAYGQFVCDGANNQFAIKEKDNVMTQFFDYMNKSGFDPEESDDDDSVLDIDSD